MLSFLFNRIGKLNGGDYDQWFIEIIYCNNSGGYIVYLFDNFPVVKVCYDYWLEDLNWLENTLKGLEISNIEWLSEELSIHNKKVND